MSSKKSLFLALVLIVSLLSLFLVEPICAQSTKPSPPEFTAQAPNESTVELVIRNQAFTRNESVNAITYDYRVKNHNSEQWIRHGGLGELQSEASTTTITIKTPYQSDYPFTEGMKTFVNSSLLDFQVRANTGYYLIVPIYGGSDISFNVSETSDWSNTQTVNLTQSSSPHPTATMQPTAAPTASPTPTSSPTSFQFSVPVGDKTYPVTANSNSTVTDLTFNPATRELNFKANGQTGTTGYCRITIPTNLVWGELSIYKDEVLLVKNVDYTQSNDGTNNILQINYSHSTHNFKIVGTQAIPEFPLLLILIGLAGLISLLIVTIGRSKGFSIRYYGLFFLAGYFKEI